MSSTNGDRYFLDTNVLVYANDRSDPQRQAAASRLVVDGIRSRQGVISSQVLSEFWVAVTRNVEVPLPLEAALAELQRLGSMLVVGVGYDTVNLAVHVQTRHGISYWDALVLAAAQIARCSIVYSENLTSGRHYGDLLVQNPFLAPGETRGNGTSQREHSTES